MRKKDSKSNWKVLVTKTDNNRYDTIHCHSEADAKSVAEGLNKLKGYHTFISSPELAAKQLAIPAKDKT